MIAFVVPLLLLTFVVAAAGLAGTLLYLVLGDLNDDVPFP